MLTENTPPEIGTSLHHNLFSCACTVLYLYTECGITQEEKACASVLSLVAARHGHRVDAGAVLLVVLVRALGVGGGWSWSLLVLPLCSSDDHDGDG